MPEEQFNPFEATQSDLSEGAREPLPELHGRMPGSVVVAVSCVAFIVILFGLLILAGGVTLGYGETWLLEFVILGVLFALGLLVLIGLCLRNRLARLWGRIFGLLGAVLPSLMVVTVIGLGLCYSSEVKFGGFTLRTGLVSATVHALPASLLWTTFFALGKPTALQWFGMICPECQSRRTRPKNFLYTRSRCKECAAVW